MNEKKLELSSVNQKRLNKIERLNTVQRISQALIRYSLQRKEVLRRRFENRRQQILQRKIQKEKSKNIGKPAVDSEKL
jgi:hypothetical protein